MDRRKFIRKTSQLIASGLITSTIGCQGSWFDPFAQPANEAIVAETGTTRRIFKVNLNSGAVSVIHDGSIFTANLHGLALIDQDTALVTSQAAGGDLYKIDLTNNAIQLLTSGYVPGFLSRGIALENSNSLLIASTDGNISRMNLSTLAITKTQNIIGSPLEGLLVESGSSALGLARNNNLYRINLSDFSFSTLVFGISGAASSGRTIAINTDRNLAFIGQTDALTQIEKVDLSTGTQILPDLGAVPGGAGRGIAVENSYSILTGDNGGGGGLYRVNIDTGVTSRVDDLSLTGIGIRNIAVRFQ